MIRPRYPRDGKLENGRDEMNRVEEVPTGYPRLLYRCKNNHKQDKRARGLGDPQELLFF